MAATLPATPYDPDSSHGANDSAWASARAPARGPVGRHGVLAARARRGLADAGCCWSASSSRCSSAPRRRSSSSAWASSGRTEWDPVQEKFGGLVMIYGTLMTSFIALLIAVPVSFGIALFLTELSPAWLKRPLGIAIELLAAVPSIVYGMWGLLVFGPILATYVQQPLQALFGGVPVLGALFSGPPVGIGILSAGIILAIMIIPVHRLGDARRVRGHAADAEGVGLRAGLDHLGSGLQGRAALHQDRCRRRHHARPGPRAGRDDGGDLRHRQLQPARFAVAVRGGQQHHLGAGQRIRRSRRRACTRRR